MTLAARVAAAADRIAGSGVPRVEARSDAVLLARRVLNWDAGQWIAHQREAPPAHFDSAFDAWVARRAAREPVAYILGEREFYGRAFRVTPAVLIPRPETELLVDEAIAALDAGPRRPPDGAAPIAIDVGTGSGCLAISIALERPGTRVVATDVSAAALAVAHDNAARLGAHVELNHGSLLAGLPDPVDVIVSNPPYVSDADRPNLPPEVRDYEPALALFGGLDGLDVIRQLLAVAAAALRPDGTLLIELGAGQAPAIARLIADMPGLTLDRMRLDAQSIARVAIARKA